MIVIGARIAGSIVAALLGDAGYRILLVDRATFPSSTLSTHFFSGAGLLAVLDRLGVLSQVLALGSPPLVRSYTYTNGARQALIEPPFSPGAIGYCLSVRREPLDAILVRRACQSPSVHFVEHARVSAPLWQEGRVIGVKLVSSHGEQSVRARLVIGADGRHSGLARAVKATTEESAPGCRALYYAYVHGFLGPWGAKSGWRGILPAGG